MAGGSSTDGAIMTLDGVGQVFSLPRGSATVLEDISFSVKPNSFTIIHGPSGSGKTTLLNILSGLQKPTSGTISICGQKVYDLPTDALAHFRSKRLGLVYQANYWVKSLSVLENVAMPLYVAGWKIADANKLAYESLKSIHLEEYAPYKPTLLSGGQQQRVSLARSLVANPEIILADEPTGNLDTKSGDMVMDLLKKVQKEMGRTIILITHNMDYLRYSDTQVEILDGHMIANNRKDAKKLVVA